MVAQLGVRGELEAATLLLPPGLTRAHGRASGITAAASPDLSARFMSHWPLLFGPIAEPAREWLIYILFQQETHESGRRR